MLITLFIFHRKIKNIIIFIKLHLREDFYFILIMSYLLYQNNNLVGGFDELSKAKDMAQGILNNGWAKDFSIVKYKKNSCIKEDTIIINNNDEDVKTDEPICIVKDEKTIELEKKYKSDMQKKLNLLTQQKDKLEESKTKYDIDLKLYYSFKSKLEEDISFNIPELFEGKYKLFHQLEVQNNLDWETFARLYKEEDFHGNVTSVFDITNDFEKKFLTNIDTDSDTESDTESDDNSDYFSDSLVQVINSSEDEN
jgi:hypothetical protein